MTPGVRDLSAWRDCSHRDSGKADKDISSASRHSRSPGGHSAASSRHSRSYDRDTGSDMGTRTVRT